MITSVFLIVGGILLMLVSLGIFSCCAVSGQCSEKEDEENKDDERYIKKVDGMYSLNIPKPNGWICYLHGHNTPIYACYSLMDDQKPPMFFHRKMQELCFGIKWRYNA